MPNLKNPHLGDNYYCGDGYMIYTLNGWCKCDNEKELKELENEVNTVNDALYYAYK